YEAITRPITFTYEYYSGSKKYSEQQTIDLKAGIAMPVPKYATKDQELHSISYTLQEMLQKNL
ncbi:MAG: hypothetical protein Q4B26_03820, partial [Eubacteriales bacterium]|nr:hypothetical protein [Eubacteriales bacterium]